MARIGEELQKTDNRSVLKKAARKVVAIESRKCDRCPPHGGENAKRKPRSDRHKNHRKV